MKLALKLIGIVIFIVILLTAVDFSRLLTTLQTVRPDLALLSLLLFFPLMIVQAFRWWLVCRQLKIEVGFTALLEIYYISWFLGSIPMSGATPFSKTLYLKTEGFAWDRSAAVVVIDKVLDLLGTMGFALFGLSYLPHQYLVDFLSGWIYVAGGGMVLFILFQTRLMKKAWDRIWTFFVRRLGDKAPDVASILTDFRQGIGVRTGFAHLLLIVAIGLMRSVILYVLALSLSLNVSFWLMVACRSLIGAINIVPISINGLGTRDAVLLLILPLWGITKEAAVALAFLAFIWAVFTKLSGVLFWLKRH